MHGNDEYDLARTVSMLQYKVCTAYKNVMLLCGIALHAISSLNQLSQW